MRLHRVLVSLLSLLLLVSIPGGHTHAAPAFGGAYPPSPPAVEPSRTGRPSGPGDARATLAPGAILERVRHYVDEDAVAPGRLVAEDDTYAVELEAGAFRIFPGGDGARDLGDGYLELDLRDVTRGGRSLIPPGFPDQDRHENQVRIDRGPGVLEQYEMRNGYVVHRWRIEEGGDVRGPLRIGLTISGMVGLEDDPDGMLLESETGGRVRHALPMVRDARGRELEAELLEAATQTQDGIEIVVADRSLAQARWPLTVEARLEPMAAASPYDITISAATDDQQLPTVSSGSSSVLVVWEDTRSRSTLGRDIYGARVDLQGNLLDPSGIAIAATAGDQRWPTVAWGDGYWMVAWADPALNEVHGVKVTPEGKLVDFGFQVFDEGGPDESYVGTPSAPSIAWGGDSFFLAWHSDYSGFNWSYDYEIHGLEFHPAWGAFQARLETLSVGSSGYDASPVTVASTGGSKREGNFLIAWLEGCTSCGYFTSGVVWEGGYPDESFGTPGVATHNAAYYPRATWQGAQYLLAYADTTADSAVQQLKGLFVTLDGALNGGVQLGTVPTYAGRVDYDAAYDGANVLVSWSWYDISSSVYRLDGAWYDATGRKLAYTFPVKAQSPSPLKVNVDGRNRTFFLAWEAYISSKDDVHGALLKYDADADGIDDTTDNCPSTANADQKDTDKDGDGDACDRCPKDAADDVDADGICGDVDNCPATTNADQKDTDKDGVGDACDVCGSSASGDTDKDSVCDNVDNCVVTANADQKDTDKDGAGDPCDACPKDAANDADKDGICGDLDNCPATSNASQADTDRDGAGDACDKCPQDSGNDSDRDGICGDLDNCPLNANPGQEDGDADGIGDVCDACGASATGDSDRDGFCDDVDNCASVPNDQTDADGDSRGDVCDVCPKDAADDVDADGICGSGDNCPDVPNVSQTDADGDGLGDACDYCPRDSANDADQDGRCADVDNCPKNANPDQADGDGDGIGDVCECGEGQDSDRDGLCDEVDNCPSAANADQADRDGDGRGDECDSCPKDAANDIDHDGRCADADNCPEYTNPDQADADRDGIGDICDVCSSDPGNDADKDYACDDVDTCPGLTNYDQSDSDRDGLGDACDVCVYGEDNDSEGDGFCGSEDNCLDAYNPDQADFDNDGAGDACDSCPLDPFDDVDEDGACGEADNCADIANPDQQNSDGDFSGDACDPCPVDPLDDGDGDGICGDVDNCPESPNSGQEDLDQDGLGDACDPAEETPSPEPSEPPGSPVGGDDDTDGDDDQGSGSCGCTIPGSSGRPGFSSLSPLLLLLVPASRLRVARR